MLSKVSESYPQRYFPDAQSLRVIAGSKENLLIYITIILVYRKTAKLADQKTMIGTKMYANILCKIDNFKQ